MNNLKVSEGWAGFNTLPPPDDDAAKRANSIWVESKDLSSIGSDEPISLDEYSSLLKHLKEKGELTLVHENEVGEDFTDYNKIINDSTSSLPSWRRARVHKNMKNSKVSETPILSHVYEDTIAISIPSNDGGGKVRPMVSCFPVQQSKAAALDGCWVRVIGIVKYWNTAFALIQEYDGDGCIVAFKGNHAAEMRPQFLLEVIMCFSDWYNRDGREMWIAKRYEKFLYRYATWSAPTTDELGSHAQPFYDSMKEALSQMGYPEISDPIIKQLERINDAFKVGNVLVSK